MRNNKQNILDRVYFIEEHSEYVLPDDATWNDMQNFVHEHYEEVYEEYQLELCGYVEIEY